CAAQFLSRKRFPTETLANGSNEQRIMAGLRQRKHRAMQARLVFMQHYRLRRAIRPGDVHTHDGTAFQRNSRVSQSCHKLNDAPRCMAQLRRCDFHFQVALGMDVEYEWQALSA